MSGAHTRPSHPGRAVLALAALALTPPALVLTPRALAATPGTSTPDTAPDAGAGQADHRGERHPDRFGERPGASSGGPGHDRPLQQAPP